tara:strand:+ start:17881 stop:18063 length:183 start_codon:yes stop_codon:yes gene_type:complete
MEDSQRQSSLSSKSGMQIAQRYALKILSGPYRPDQNSARQRNMFSLLNMATLNRRKQAFG